MPTRKQRSLWGQLSVACDTAGLLIRLPGRAFLAPSHSKAVTWSRRRVIEHGPRLLHTCHGGAESARTSLPGASVGRGRKLLISFACGAAPARRSAGRSRGRAGVQAFGRTVGGRLGGRSARRAGGPAVGQPVGRSGGREVGRSDGDRSAGRPARPARSVGRSDGRLVGRGVGRPVGRASDCTVGRPSGWAGGRPVRRPAGRSVGRSGGRAVERAGARPAASRSARSVGWSVGWSGGQSHLEFALDRKTRSKHVGLLIPFSEAEFSQKVHGRGMRKTASQDRTWPQWAEWYA